MRTLRGFGLVALGLIGGFAAAAALLKGAFRSRGDETSDEIELVAVFDGVSLRSRATAFRGGSLLSWFGGIAVDLREAELAPDCRLRVTSVFGGIAIRVRPEWRVESNVQTIAGGAAIGTSATAPDAPRLVLDGTALFGGVAVGTKTPDV